MMPPKKVHGSHRHAAREPDVVVLANEQKPRRSRWQRGKLHKLNCIMYHDVPTTVTSPQCSANEGQTKHPYIIISKQVAIFPSGYFQSDTDSETYYSTSVVLSF